MSKKRQIIPKYKQVRISAKLHKALKMAAAKDEMKVSALAERILREEFSIKS